MFLRKKENQEAIYEHFLHPVPLDDRQKKVLKLALELKGKVKNVLDVGCGHGDFTILLKETVAADTVYGIDISRKLCEEARQRGVEAICLDIEKETPPFSDEYFDLILCSEVIEHLYNTDHLLEEVYRLLKPGGFCIITTPNLGVWFNRLSLLLGFQPHLTAVSLKYYQAGKLFRGALAGVDHVRVMTLPAFKELVKNHNFYIERLVGGYGRFGTPLPPIIALAFRLLNRIFCSPSLAGAIIAVLSKTQRSSPSTRAN